MITLTASSLRRSFLSLVLACSPLLARAASSFEGTIDIAMADSKHPENVHTLHYLAKGNKVRFEMPEMGDSRHGGGPGGGVLIADFDAQQMVILIDANGQKLAMRRPFPNLAAMGNNRAGTGTPPVATGKTDTIAGYTATEYQFTDEKGHVGSVWLAKGLGKFMFPGAASMGRQAAANSNPGWASFVNDGNFFPLRVTSAEKNGNISRWEVTKITQQSMPDSLFSSEGYQDFQIPSFGGVGR